MRSDTCIRAAFASLALAALLGAQCRSGPGIRELPPVPTWNPTDTVRTPPPTVAPPAVPRVPVPAKPRLGLERPALPGAGARPSGPTTPSMARGVALDMRRDQQTSSDLMIDWQVVLPPAIEQPLSWERAVETLAAGSDKPLLVRRQAHPLEADQNARISEVLDVETMQILSRWFRCIELPDVTRNPLHPLSGLYAPDAPPLLFVVDPDATDELGFSGLEPASLIRAGIEAAIERNYEGDARRAIRRVQQLLGRCDMLYAEERELMMRRDRKLESGADDRAIAKIEARLDECREELDEIHAGWKKIVDSLELRKPVPDAGADGASEAAKAPVAGGR